jgi:hypothetical protein
MDKTKRKSGKNKDNKHGQGTPKEFNTIYMGSIEELLTSEFYQCIKYDPIGKEFLKQLKEKGIAKAIIGGNMRESLVLEAKKTGDQYQFSAVEIEKPAYELTDCLGTEMIEENDPT